MSISDSLCEIYDKNFDRIDPKYFEYVNNRLIYIDSISMEDKYILDCQADSFSIGYHTGPFPTPPPSPES